MTRLVICVLSSRRRQTRWALVTGVQTCALPIFTASTTGNSSQSLPGNVGDAGAGACGVAAWVMLGLVGQGVRARDVLPAVRLQPEAGGEALGSHAVNQSVGSTSWTTTRTAVAGDPRCAQAASVTARANAAFCSWLRQ